MQEMKRSFCIPIIKNTKKEVLAVISQNKKNYDYFEVWLDYIEDLDLDFVATLETKLENKLILLFRRQKLEKPQMRKKLKEEILRNLDNSKALVDFDISSQKADVLFVKKEKLKLNLLLSYHNYSQTPSSRKLKSLLAQMNKFKPEIYKISCMCTTDEDAMRLLTILGTLKSQGKKCIILGMGAHGVHTRISGMLMGNEFSFAPMTLKEASAPGQLTQKELKDILRIIERNN